MGEHSFLPSAQRGKVILIFIFAVVILFAAYNTYLQDKRADIEGLFQAMKQAVSKRDKEKIYELMSLKYQNDHSQDDALQLFHSDHEKTLNLIEGWSLRGTGNTKRVYPYRTKLLGFDNGPEYVIIYHNNEWRFTGDVVYSFD